MKSNTFLKNDWYFVGSLALMFFAMMIPMVGCGSRLPREKDLAQPDAVAARPTSALAIEAFCGDCHGVPNPQSFGKERWHKEVKQGFRLYDQSGRDDLVLPDFEATLAYFQTNAPEALTFERPASVPDTRFRARPIPLASDAPIIAIAHLFPLPRQDDSSPIEFAMADIGSGTLSSLSVSNFEAQRRKNQSPGSIPSLPIKMWGKASHPAHIESVDLDQDGITDYVVADLGTMNPTDQQQANLWFYRGLADGDFQRQVLKLGLSRLSSVRAIDHDLDGDIDLVVSDFGLHFVGSIYLLTNIGIQNNIPQFDWQVIDDRAGAIDTPIVDFDLDGRPDIVALVSQQHETIDIHFNRGDGRFEKQRIHEARWPSHGSSGLEVVDFDQDGDLDVVYTNGDTFDDQLAKPYHAIHWLENEGAFPFRDHVIDSMPGVYCARTGDIDLDGDLDIAAVSLLGQPEILKQPPGSFEGVVWLEQLKPGEFRRHAMQVDRCDAVTCELFDWDGDGDLDLLVPPSNEKPTETSHLTVYFNQTRNANQTRAESP